MNTGRKRPRTNSVLVPRSQLDEVGAPLGEPKRERVTISRPDWLPGVEVWRAQKSVRLWRVYHADYAFCTLDDARCGSRAMWRYRNRDIEMTPTGQQVFEPGLAHHTFRVEGPPADFHVLTVRPERMASLLGCEPPHLGVFTEDPRLQRLHWVACRTILAACDPLTAELALVDYAQGLFGAIGERKEAISGPRFSDRRANRIREMIHSGYQEELNLTSLAAEVGLSPPRLVNLFRSCSSLPVHQYVIALRLARALRLMTEGRAPSDAAFDAGFYDLRHFGRVLKKQYGFTPRQYFEAGNGERRRMTSRAKRNSVLPG